MSSLALFIVISLVVYALMYGVMRLAMASKGFKARPAEEQAQVRKTYTLALIVAPLMFIGSYFLRGA